jgi:hypothetical protein
MCQGIVVATSRSTVQLVLDCNAWPAQKAAAGVSPVAALAVLLPNSLLEVAPLRSLRCVDACGRPIQEQLTNWHSYLRYSLLLLLLARHAWHRCPPVLCIIPVWFYWGIIKVGIQREVHGARGPEEI